MNIIERTIYNLVKSNPQLKMRIRDGYQSLCDLVPVIRNSSAYPVAVHEKFFFGFHDKSPWSPCDRYLLAHHELIGLRMPTADDSVEVGYFNDGGRGDFVALARSRAWNWHQGAQIQWLGPAGNVVFNDFDGHKHVARILSLTGVSEKILDRPVAATSPDGKHALSYSFARLRATPHGYAYYNGLDPEADQLIPKNDGLWLVQTETNQSQLLFTVDQIAGLSPDSTMQGAFHYFSHCQFSPSGKRFKFFHRWTVDDNRNCTRMITADLDGKNIHIFPTSGMVSHVAWRDSNHIVAYARTAEHGDGYYEFRDRTQEVRLFGAESFSSDGHPSYSKDGRWMLTDTYADRFRRRYLILYDMREGKRYNLAMFFSPKEFAGRTIAEHLQCDFHPRWNRRNTQLCFDSAHTGVRSLCVMEIGQLHGDALHTIK